jgi:hypothetical protein
MTPRSKSALIATLVQYKFIKILILLLVNIASTGDDESDDNCEEFGMYRNSHVNDDNESDADDEGDEGELILYLHF